MTRPGDGRRPPAGLGRTRPDAGPGGPGQVQQDAGELDGRIANYFVARQTNGRTEGFNRGLRGLLWRACGMTNFAHFRLRVLHAFG